jgi:hypothetical protein
MAGPFQRGEERIAGLKLRGVDMREFLPLVGRVMPKPIPGCRRRTSSALSTQGGEWSAPPPVRNAEILLGERHASEATVIAAEATAPMPEEPRGARTQILFESVREGEPSSLVSAATRIESTYRSRCDGRAKYAPMRRSSPLKQTRRFTWEATSFRGRRASRAGRSEAKRSARTAARRCRTRAGPTETIDEGAPLLSPPRAPPR